VTVGLVLVSHSAQLAQGVAELAAQMAPDVTVLPVGGLPDGGLGTDYDSVANALDRADGGDGVVVLYDLGSAQMTAELAVEALGDPSRAFVVEAPFVEGAVAAAVAAQGGADLDGVAEAAAAAAGVAGDVAAAAGTPTAGSAADAAGATGVAAEPVTEEVAEIELRNEVGLHARPAALLARAINELQAEVVIGFREQEVDARSVLALMALGARGGDRVVVRARGPEAREALRRIHELNERRFDE